MFFQVKNAKGDLIDRFCNLAYEKRVKEVLIEYENILQRIEDCKNSKVHDFRLKRRCEFANDVLSEILFLSEKPKVSYTKKKF